MTSELIQTSVYISKNQQAYLRDNYVNLSRLTRAGLNNLMNKKSEGSVLTDKPTDESHSGDSNIE